LINKEKYWQSVARLLLSPAFACAQCEHCGGRSFAQPAGLPRVRRDAKYCKQGGHLHRSVINPS